MIRSRTFSSRMGALGVVAVATLSLGAHGASAAGGNWTRMAPVPAVGQGVEGMAVGVINGKIIAAFGFDPGTKRGDTKTTRIYDISSDHWTVLHGLKVPGGARSEAGSVVVGGKLYVVGGGIRAGVLPYTDSFDPSTKHWAKLASLPDVADSHGRMHPDKKAGLGLAAVGNDIYAIGGRDTPDGPCSPPNPTGVLSTVERYNISSDHWSFVAPLPSARSDLAAATVNGKIWVFGGCTVSETSARKFTREVDMYDPATDTWTKEKNLPSPAAAFSQVAAIGATVYVIGGYAGGSQPLSQTWAYDTTTGKTTTLAPMITPRGEMGVVADNGSIYTVGGSIPAYGNSTDENDRFTP